MLEVLRNCKSGTCINSNKGYSMRDGQACMGLSQTTSEAAHKTTSCVQDA